MAVDRTVRTPLDTVVCTVALAALSFGGFATCATFGGADRAAPDPDRGEPVTPPPPRAVPSPTSHRAAQREDDTPAAASEAAPSPADTDTFHLVPDGTTTEAAVRRLRGRVVDAAGAPVAGATVGMHSTWLAGDDADARCDFDIGQSFCWAEWTGAASRTTTGADGAFSLRFVEGGVRTLFVLDGREVRWIAWDPPADEPVTISLTPWTARAEGHVAATDGTPVAGAEVILRATTAPVPFLRGYEMHACDPPCWTATATTDADGRWSVEGVPGVPIALGVHRLGFRSSADRGLPAPRDGRTWSEVRLEPVEAAR